MVFFTAFTLSTDVTVDAVVEGMYIVFTIAIVPSSNMVDVIAVFVLRVNKKNPSEELIISATNNKEYIFIINSVLCSTSIKMAGSISCDCGPIFY